MTRLCEALAGAPVELRLRHQCLTHEVPPEVCGLLPGARFIERVTSLVSAGRVLTDNLVYVALLGLDAELQQDLQTGRRPIGHLMDGRPHRRDVVQVGPAVLGRLWAFADALRQGQWGEVSLRPSRPFRLSSDIRSSGGGSEGKSQAFTASASATQLTPLGLGLRARTTQYTGAITEGRLSSVAVEVAPGQAVRLSLNAGVRTSLMPSAGLPATRLTWAGGDLDVAVGRSLYIMLSTYRESGTASASVQTYAAVTWRF